MFNLNTRNTCAERSRSNENRFHTEGAEAAFLQSCKSYTSGFLPVAPETNLKVDQPLRELSGFCEKPFKLYY
ncbi:MAG: hypothetical protein A2096_14905 [Spirochaetes bacterium GWF1_41_5]|nr:MAG: hypothetical protein A2096_14905 [Spirochaetes bacterium GWF1_41_5]